MHASRKKSQIKMIYWKVMKLVIYAAKVLFHERKVTINNKIQTGNNNKNVL